MKKLPYKSRIIDVKIDELLRTFGAVCIEGPRRCGKTRTAKAHAASGIFLEDPAGNFHNEALAKLAPAAVLEGASPRLIDEWQEVPPVWDAVSHYCDTKQEKSLFILTGSARSNHKGVMHGGAGRIATVRMSPMSLYESGNSSGEVSLKSLITEGFVKAVKTSEITLDKLAEMIVRGGWPGSQDIPPENCAAWARRYLDSALGGYIYLADGVKRDPHKLELLCRSLARNECTAASTRSLCRDIKEHDGEDVTVVTVRKYLEALERIFLTDNQQAFSPKIMSSTTRAKQAAKRHFADPSLACAALGLDCDGLMGDLKTMEVMFEALCERDLRIYASACGARLFHYRDYNDREIDAVVEMPDGSWGAFEIRLGTYQTEEAALRLLKLKQAVSKAGGGAPQALCVICGVSGAAYTREDGVITVPITALKP